jgi:hypothetical protein
MTGNQSRTNYCPWCGETGIRVDTRRLDGGKDAIAHVRRCPVLRAIKQEDDRGR